ncbi:MAG TPA: tripartite tricarboxylate transporter substrate binding protein [Quisquiliibacterium sp.]|nr:tripartite tricarboxylate transporter substrate binding protein [Quisquiliibacterium sp.]HPA88915.1 tripartite tricarboxylate transporter substrate binding protein [Quisquiliibacterium sp.]HQN13587.1 tripartite tricarboxylate transporter substrate binding protein [Quisquiliibacterium sp.]
MFRFARSLLTGLACAAALAGPAGAQQAYPSKPIRIVVPYAPGGATDLMARVVAPRLGEILGQPVVIDNKPGANTAIGADAVAKSPADGYTLMFTNDATFVLNPALFSNLSYNMARDFVPVATVAYLNLSLTVSSALPVNTFAELVAWTRSKSGTISYGSYGVGSQAHLMGEMYKKLTATDIVHVPYKGSAPALADVVGGQVVFTFPGIPTVQGFLKAGKVKVLAISGEKRSPLLPDVPTFTELGYKDMDIGAWYALFAPAGTPRDVVNRLNAAIGTMLNNPEFVEKQLVPSGMVPMNLSPERVAALMRSEGERMAHIVRQSGAKVE